MCDEDAPRSPPTNLPDEHQRRVPRRGDGRRPVSSSASKASPAPSTPSASRSSTPSTSPPETSSRTSAPGTGFFSFLFADAVGPDGPRPGRGDLAAFPRPSSERAVETPAASKTSNVVEGRTELRGAPDRPARNVAFICDVYHHFESPTDSLASLYDAIAPGGQLVLIEFHRIEGVDERVHLIEPRSSRPRGLPGGDRSRRLPLRRRDRARRASTTTTSCDSTRP